MLKGSSSTFQVPAATAAAVVVVRPSRRRVLKALQALLLQAFHLYFTSHTKPVHLRRMTCLRVAPPITAPVISMRSRTKVRLT